MPGDALGTQDVRDPALLRLGGDNAHHSITGDVNERETLSGLVEASHVSSRPGQTQLDWSYFESPRELKDQYRQLIMILISCRLKCNVYDSAK
jgi:hypothetical protein